MRFYLGTHCVSWLKRLDVPLFVSINRLRHRATMPRARTKWALDSGAFTEVSKHGRWTVTPESYVADVRRVIAGVGDPDFVGIQDWMCEPNILELTRLTVGEHQERTIESLLTLRKLAPEINWLPTLQGWSIFEYMDHIDMYRDAGIDLTKSEIVGIGSVCRRQHTSQICSIIEAVYRRGITAHGFGVKTTGLRMYSRWLASADSMAWSFRARKIPPLEGCTHKACNNCARFALQWYNGIQSILATPTPVQANLALWCNK